jgi:hypothetical protein
MDPLSVTASIVGIVAFATQVNSAITAFMDAYRATDSELHAIAAEVDAMHHILERLQNTYEASNAGLAEAHSRQGNKPWQSFSKSKHHIATTSNTRTDKALMGVLDGLNGSLKKLDDIVKKSGERMVKGGVHKLRVRAMWHRTAVGIEKVFFS